MFAHVLLPHDPYVFRADGTVIPEEEAKREEEKDLYRGHLAFANANIKSIVDDLLSGPDDEDPIVIVQADEGPLFCRSVDCPEESVEYAATRFGVLNAMYLPGIDERLPETFTTVNTFRTIFREYFGADLPNLPDHSYTLARQRPHLRLPRHDRPAGAARRAIMAAPIASRRSSTPCRRSTS